MRGRSLSSASLIRLATTTAPTSVALEIAFVTHLATSYIQLILYGDRNAHKRMLGEHGDNLRCTLRD